MRICSLLPSATEIVASLGLLDSLVGVSDECDWPPDVCDLPVVTASRVDTTRLTSSARKRRGRHRAASHRRCPTPIPGD
jgi:iron complex transport system substrate-binding protein